jgi:hypothetical protein
MPQDSKKGAKILVSFPEEGSFEILTNVKTEGDKTEEISVSPEAQTDSHDSPPPTGPRLDVLETDCPAANEEVHRGDEPPVHACLTKTAISTEGQDHDPNLQDALAPEIAIKQAEEEQELHNLFPHEPTLPDEDILPFELPELHLEEDQLGGGFGGPDLIEGLQNLEPMEEVVVPVLADTEGASHF